MNPEWILAGCALGGSLIAVVVWAYNTFQTKEEAEQANAKHEDLKDWVKRQDTTLQKVAQDVSYIRGNMEGRGLADRT